MNIGDKIDRLSKRLEKHGLANEKTILYAVGLREKLLQVEFALSMMQYWEAMEKYGRSPSELDKVLGTILDTTNNQISFYCDCFWDFLWSAADILGQLINQVFGLKLPEKAVDFKRVANKLQSDHATNPLTKRVIEFRRGRAWRQLEGYRHCSTHRRPVYIQTQIIRTAVTGRSGYPASTESLTQIVRRYLCNNPSELNPVVTNRELIPYCNWVKDQIEYKMGRILYWLGKP